MKDTSDFLGNKFSWGIILRANLNTIEEIKEFIAKQNGISIVFQKLSTEKLFIKEGTP